MNSSLTVLHITPTCKDYPLKKKKNTLSLTDSLSLNGQLVLLKSEQNYKRNTAKWKINFSYLLLIKAVCLIFPRPCTLRKGEHF